MNTLSDGGTSVQLDQSLFWLDRHSWAPVEQSSERSITGALILQARALSYGRPITLGGDRPGQGWMALDALTQCRAWAAVAGQALTLTWLGETHRVVWRHHDRAIEAEPLQALADEAAQDHYVVILRLMTVQP